MVTSPNEWNILEWDEKTNTTYGRQLLYKEKSNHVSAIHVIIRQHWTRKSPNIYSLYRFMLYI